MNRILLAVFSVVILVAAGYFINNLTNSRSASPTKTYEVILDENGFQPSILEIKRGEAVRFKTKTGKIFWPASNLHPTHELYPEFDPNNPIGPDESWSFTFNKSGQWRYHDHLAPGLVGTIIVKD